MILAILRGAFLVLVAAVAALYLIPNQRHANVGFAAFVILLCAVMAVAVAIISIDFATPHKKLSAVAGVFLGLIAGLVAAYALSFVVDLIGLLTAPSLPSGLDLAHLTTAQRNVVEARDAYFNLLQGVKVLIGFITCYISISLVLQTKDDFRFVIPYIEFSKQIRGNRPTVLDTSVIIDGRVRDLLACRVIQGQLILPRFVLNELQMVADSSDKLRRARGRRGLDVLQQLQNDPHVDLTIDESDPEAGSVDQKLIVLAQQMQARVMTNDFNLNKIATLRGVAVVNLNEVAKALRPVVLPGEHMRVRLVKAGENPTQGVGYLDDGTMVVVEDGRRHVGQEIDLLVTSMLQTSAGRMVFGRYTTQVSDTDDAASNGGMTGVAAATPDDGSQASSITGLAEPITESSQPAPRNHGGRNPRRS